MRQYLLVSGTSDSFLLCILHLRRPRPSPDWPAGNGRLGSFDPRIFSLENNSLLMLGCVLNLISGLFSLSIWKAVQNDKVIYNSELGKWAGWVTAWKESGSKRATNTTASKDGYDRENTNTIRGRKWTGWVTGRIGFG